MVALAALIIGPLLGGLEGCSKAKNNAGGNDSKILNPVVIQSADLFGSWNSSCTDADLFGLSQNSRLNIDGSKISKMIRYHSNGDCSGSAVEVESSGVVKVGSEVKSGVHTIDFVISEIHMRPLSRTGERILNTAKFCGISNWTIGDSKNLTGLTGKENCYPRLPQKLYDIYSIDKNRLMFGKAIDLKDSTRRPSELDADLHFERVL
jgi:hypothetical protein